MPVTDEHLIPAIPIHPGEILADELGARGMTRKQLAEQINRPHQTINLIVNGRKGISEDTALDLETAFDIPAEFWLQLDMLYRLDLARTRRQLRKAG